MEKGECMKRWGDVGICGCSFIYQVIHCWRSHNDMLAFLLFFCVVDCVFLCCGCGCWPISRRFDCARHSSNMLIFMHLAIKHGASAFGYRPNQILCTIVRFKKQPSLQIRTLTNVPWLYSKINTTVADSDSISSDIVKRFSRCSFKIRVGSSLIKDFIKKKLKK